MNAELLKATPDDIEAFNYDGIEKEMLKSVPVKEQLRNYFNIGLTWKVQSADRVVHVLTGYYNISPGVLHCWMLLNKTAGRYAKYVVNSFRKELDIALQNGNHRIQIYVIENDRRASGFVELMGFKKEFCKKQFGPNRENMNVYVMFKEEKP